MSEQFSVIYEDRDLVVVNKSQGLLSQADMSRDPDLLTLLSKHYAEQNQASRVYAVHRLDRGVGGLMVVARTEKAAAKLSAAVSDHSGFVKEYLAVLHGVPDELSARLEDFLYHDARARKTISVSRDDKRGKRAVLSYRVLDRVHLSETKSLALAIIRLETGRTHQIRAQFSSHGHPLAGDGRYGARDRYADIALFSAHLSFVHPATGKRVSFCAQPEGSSAFSEFSISESLFERSLSE